MGAAAVRGRLSAAGLARAAAATQAVLKMPRGLGLLLLLLLASSCLNPGKQQHSHLQVAPRTATAAMWSLCMRSRWIGHRLQVYRFSKSVLCRILVAKSLPKQPCAPANQQGACAMQTLVSLPGATMQGAQLLDLLRAGVDAKVTTIVGNGGTVPTPGAGTVLSFGGPISMAFSPTEGE